ncbi:acyl transferase 5-like [Phoenix dactylifera]|uniref:Acyl transferase 5-like n=1 Tax=Phoenix dactylifera TaxID=42345 RepID=A0A8B7CYV0_PHODC|nr:acyl transferase 5-like [Phoenix dactylifera]
MSFSVTKLAPAIVGPCEPTPSASLPLSPIDRAPGMRRLIDLFLVFGQPAQDPAKVVREALSRALVSYYPVAGRFAVSDNGELAVACTGDGIWFVEASADCSLKDVNNLERPFMIPKEELIPCPPPQVSQEDVFLMLQVTQFSCGGYVVGIRFNHAIFDGVGVAQFLKAIAELAKGLARPTVEPIWCREAIPDPPKLVPQGPPPVFQPLALEQSILDISLDRIDRIKSQFTSETGQKCSTFDAVGAVLWHCRTRAINLEPQADAHLAFPVSTRRLLQEVLPKEEGYYGNCVYPMAITAPGEKIKKASVVEIVSLIREAKESVPTKFSRWVKGDPREGPCMVPLEYGSLCVTDWSRVGFYEVDFGWGGPIQVAPLTEDDLIPWCILLQSPAPMRGVRLLLRCLLKEHLEAFHDQMSSLV